MIVDTVRAKLRDAKPDRRSFGLVRCKANRAAPISRKLFYFVLLFWSLCRANRAFVIWGDGFFELANRLAERFPQIRNLLRTENQQCDEKNQKQVGWLQ